MSIFSSSSNQSLTTTSTPLFNNVTDALTVTVTSGATTTLTSASTNGQVFTGSTTQTLVLPVVSTLSLGTSYRVINRSSGVVTVESSGGNTIQAMAQNTSLLVICISLTGTDATSWQSLYVPAVPFSFPLSGALGGTGVANTGLTINLGSGSSSYVLTSDSSGNATWQAQGYLSGAVLLAPSGIQTITNYDLVVNTVNVGLGASNIATDTSLGFQALAALSQTGVHNTAVGYQAMNAMVSGSNNLAVGYSALSANTNGTGNVAIGRLAMSGGSSGSNNVAIGSGCLNNASFNSVQNNAIGTNTLSSLTTGNSNTVMGDSCATAMTTGNNNVIYGRSSGQILTTGSSNTLLGYAANASNAACSGAIAIGDASIALMASGATSADNGPGISIGSSGFPVGFRGDGSIYPSTSGAGFWRTIVNGTAYFIPLFADSSTGSGAVLLNPAGAQTISTYGLTVPTLNTTNLSFDVTSNTIASTNTNGNINFVPNGTGISVFGGLGAGSLGVFGQVQLNTNTNSIISMGSFVNSTASPYFSHVKSRSTSIGSFVAVTGGDNLGEWYFAGDDGVQYTDSALISCTVSGSVSSGIVPSLLRFYTSNTSGTLTVGMTLSNAQVLTLANALPVGSGGTGLQSATAYAVLCGGTTSSGAFQSVSGVGTSGQVLTSNGASALPTWQASSGGITTINGDSGSVTGSTVTVSGGTTGLTTSGSSATLNLTGTLKLANGGTNASLTASNGGIFYSTATAGAILAGTATAGQLLLSGSSTAPTWSTSTYPSTNAVNTLLYASSANTMAALATANDGVLVTSNSGVPSWLANSSTPGYVLTANSGAAPSWQPGATGGSGGGLIWASISGTTQSAAVGTGYIVANASQTTVTLPTTFAIGDTIEVKGLGAGGWILAAGTATTIRMGQSTTSSAGSLTSAGNYDTVLVRGLVANTTWSVDYALSAGLTIA
jgi:hypothetical protein